MSKKIALIDKIRSFYSEGPSFDIYVQNFLNKNCNVFQLDPQSIDFKTKKALSYPLFKFNGNITRSEIAYSLNLENYDAILDMSDIVNLDFAKNLQQINTFHFNLPIPTYNSANKKTYVKNYPEYIPETRITSNVSKLEDLLKNKFKGKMIVKDPSGAHGDGVFRITSRDNYNEEFKKITQNEKIKVIAQKFLHYCFEGGKRVILLGNPGERNSFEFVISYRKVPGKGQWKDNLALGGKAILTNLREDEKELCLEVAAKSGLYGIGIDIMDDKSKSGKRISRLIETNAIIATRAYPEAISKTVDFIMEKIK